ncbi:MAG: hypothetical protein J6B73_04640 [Methanobrevibacter sp.]|uniref:hypothetical protein n=1 Tax=Methanobrevibacter sp. TaxID=66852 RepID=UPI001B169746|nr:hypothetical protein [Methanobrevibacter sp.]MBO5151437.1 hypothetical protein [Methanobrevibacter sp.]
MLMSIASTVLTVNERLALARTLMKEKLTANGKSFLDDDNLNDLIERWRCLYFDRCSINNISDWTVNGSLSITYDSTNKCYNLLTTSNEKFGYATVDSEYFKLPVAIEYDFMLMQGANGRNNQLRLGLYNPWSEYSSSTPCFAVIGNVAKYSSSATEIRSGDIRTTTSDSLEVIVNNSKAYSTGVWYHAVLTISSTTTTFVITRDGNTFVSLSATTPTGLDTNYNDNQLCLSKCYNTSTNIKIKNIKVYGV